MVAVGSDRAAPWVGRASGAVTLAALGSSLLPLATVVLDVPVVTPAIALVATLLAPGMLSLIALRVVDLDPWERLGYAVGISLAFTIAVGLVLTGLGDMGLDRPLSSLPAAIALSIALFPLAVAALLRGTGWAVLPPWRDVLHPIVPLLLTPVVLSIVGTPMVARDHDNRLLIAALVMVAALPLLGLVRRGRPERWYALAVFSASLTLLLQYTLASTLLTGYDIHGEHFYSRYVIEQGAWDRSLINTYNAMLSLVILPPMLAVTSHIDVIWFYRVIAPVCFALAAVALFLGWRRQIGARVALLVVCFFMFTQPFFINMSQAARQEVALLFLALLLLTIGLKQTVLAAMLRIVFVTGVAVSHYSIAYFTIPIFVTAHLLLIGARWLAARRTDGQQRAHDARAGVAHQMLASNFILLVVVVPLMWYIYASPGSVAFSDAVQTASNVGRNLRDDFLSPRASESLSLLTGTLTPLRELTRYLHLGLQALISVGVTVATLRWLRGRPGPYDPESIALAIPAFLINVASVLVPYLTGTLHFDRMYLLTLVYLAPFAITGALAVIGWADAATRSPGRLLGRVSAATRSAPRSLTLLPIGVMLSAYALLNTGVVYELVQEQPNALPISRDWLIEHGTPPDLLALSAAYPVDADVAGAAWLGGHRTPDTRIQADQYGWAYLLRDWIPPEMLSSLRPETQFDARTYVFLRSINTHAGVMAPPQEQWVRDGQRWWSLSELVPALADTSRLYDNGSSAVLLTREAAR